MPISRSPAPTTAEPPSTLSDEEIYQRLIEAIVDQRLLPGTKLVEDKLGQAFGVSRTRIRQVLIRLAQEQVVTIQPNKGASVAEPTVAEAREVFEARTVVETVLVRRFVARAKPRDLKTLADCIDAEEVARQTGDKTMALRMSGQFHLLLAEAAAHQTFAKFLHKLVSRTSLILMSYTPGDRLQVAGTELPQRWVQACRCEEHRGLLTALRSASQGKTEADTAVRLMTEHLAHIEASLCFNQEEPAGVDVVQALAKPAARRKRASAR
jgi:DNA-binding GntR family transcriptional regulator